MRSGASERLVWGLGERVDRLYQPTNPVLARMESVGLEPSGVSLGIGFGKVVPKQTKCSGPASFGGKWVLGGGQKPRSNSVDQHRGRAGQEEKAHLRSRPVNRDFPFGCP